MPFEYDPAKSTINKAKHGIDFDEAQALWNDPWYVTSPITTHGEPRFHIVGRIGEKLWTAVATDRGGVTRIISVRRARGHEAEKYQRGRV